MLPSPGPNGRLYPFLVCLPIPGRSHYVRFIQYSGHRAGVCSSGYFAGNRCLYRYQRYEAKSQNCIYGSYHIPILNSEIVTGISLMLLFIACRVTLGFTTILLSHITFCIPYVILSVMPKLKQTDKSTYEAAQDLGAGPIYAFFKVVFPDIMRELSPAF